MSNSSLIHAPDWQLLLLSGEDAVRFLQGHLTSDVNNLSPVKGQLSAACDSKGRVLASLYLLKPSSSHNGDTEIYIFLPVEVWAYLADFWRPYLTLYKKAKMRELAGHCYVCNKDSPLKELRSPILPLNLDEKTQLILSTSATASNAINWNTWLIDNDIPHIYAAAMGKWIPQALGYDHLGAISFTKGCYIGQEVVARVHYRGKSHRLCQQLRFTLSDTPYIDMPFYNAKRDKVGNLLSFYATAANSYKGLAVINTNVVDMRHLFIQDREAFKELDSQP